LALNTGSETSSSADTPALQVNVAVYKQLQDKVLVPKPAIKICSAGLSASV